MFLRPDASRGLGVKSVSQELYRKNILRKAGLSDTALSFKQAEFITLLVGLLLSTLIFFLGNRIYAGAFMFAWLLVACIAWAIRAPESALYMLAFLLPYEQLIFKYGVGRYNSLSYLAMGLLFVWVIVFRLPRFFRKLEGPDYLYLAFVAWGLISGLWAHNFRGYVESAVTVLGGLACYLLFSRALIDQLAVRRALWFFVLGALVLGTYSLLDYDTSGWVQRGAEDDYDWVPSTLGYTTGVTGGLLGRSTSVAVVAALGARELETDRKRRMFALAVAVVLGVYTLLTVNRAAAYGLFASLLLWVLFGGHLPRKIRKVFLAATLAVGIVMAGVAINEQALQTRLVDTMQRDSFDKQNVESITTGRLTIWETGLQIAAANPLLGTGLGQFPYEYERVTGVQKGPHSYYLETQVEMGLIGLGLFLALLISFFMNGWRSGFWRAASMGWLALLVLSMATQSLDRAKDYWMALGIVCATARLCRTRELSAERRPGTLRANPLVSYRARATHREAARPL